MSQEAYLSRNRFDAIPQGTDHTLADSDLAIGALARRSLESYRRVVDNGSLHTNGSQLCRCPLRYAAESSFLFFTSETLSMRIMDSDTTKRL